MAKRVAIITFHSVHNYGAVLQAFALQNTIISLGYQCDIIDFRSETQRDFNSLYPHRNGLKSVLKNALMLKYDNERRKRVTRFDEFINNELILTSKTYIEERYLQELSNTYDYYICGSDQVWNVTKKADVSKAYFLSFVDDNRKKIAYGVSLGNATKDNLMRYKSLINSFSFISSREKKGAQILSEISQQRVETVLDPTLLLEKTDLFRITDMDSLKDTEYIFYYSLDGFDKRKRNVETLKILSEKTGLRVYILTPEWPKVEKSFTNIIDAGPREFLGLIKNAKIVCTNSFHGTALSIAFNKSFYVLEKKTETDTRKTGLLELLGIEDRMIPENSILEDFSIHEIDYKLVNNKLAGLKEHSLLFLERSFCGNGVHS